MSETCQSCGAKYDTVYQVPVDVWTKVSGRDDGNGLLCPKCCDAIARQNHGLALFWEAAVGQFPTNRPDCEKKDVHLRTAIGMICDLCRRLNPQHADCESCAEIEALRASLPVESEPESLAAVVERQVDAVIAVVKPDDPMTEKAMRNQLRDSFAMEAVVSQILIDGAGLGLGETRRRYHGVLEAINRQRATLGFAPHLDNLERLVRDLGIAIGLEAVRQR